MFGPSVNSEGFFYVLNKCYTNAIGYIGNKQMAQNIVIPGADNKVVFIFGGVDLTAASNLILTIGGETYSSTGVTPKLIVTSSTELTCDLSGTALVGRHFAKIKYFDGASVNGTDISSMELGNLDQIIIAIGTQLIIEDGSIVANANSLVSDDEYKSWASLRGLTVPATQPEREQHLINATGFIYGKESSLQGSRTSDTQALPFPRSGLVVNKVLVGNNEIHFNAKQAQFELAYISGTSGLYLTGVSRSVKKEKLGSMETVYFQGGSSAIQMQAAMSYLDALMIDDTILVRT